MVKNRRIIVFEIALVLIISIISATVITDSGFLSTSAGISREKIIILDAGHGGLTNTTH